MWRSERYIGRESSPGRAGRIIQPPATYLSPWLDDDTNDWASGGKNHIDKQVLNVESESKLLLDKRRGV